jgi:hypothetical protein
MCTSAQENPSIKAIILENRSVNLEKYLQYTWNGNREYQSLRISEDPAREPLGDKFHDERFPV